MNWKEIKTEKPPSGQLLLFRAKEECSERFASTSRFKQRYYLGYKITLLDDAVILGDFSILSEAFNERTFHMSDFSHWCEIEDPCFSEKTVIKIEL